MLISFRGCRMPTNADKFARTTRAFELILAWCRNFLHFGKPNKSQTRKFYMSWRGFDRPCMVDTMGERNLCGCKGSNNF